MGVMPDHWIREMATQHGMIEPFVENLRREGVIFYGDCKGKYQGQKGMTLPKTENNHKAA